MTATFDGIDLATGYAEGETWLITLGFGAETAVDVLEYLRAEWATPVARGNDLITLAMSIAPPPAVDMQAAYVAFMSFHSTLPREGVLAVSSGASTVSFANAVRTSTRGRRRGLTQQFDLTFVCGEPDLEPALLNTMSPNYPNLINALTGPTGGGSTKLDGLVTVGVAVGRVVQYLNTTGAVDILEDWQLTTDPAPGVTAEDASGGVVKPDDYNSSSNAKLWMRRR